MENGGASRVDGDGASQGAAPHDVAISPDAGALAAIGLAQLAFRVRIGLWIAAVAGALLAIADLSLPPGLRAQAFTLRALQLAAVVAALTSLRRMTSRRGVVGIAVAAAAAVLVSVGILRGLTNDLGMTVVLCLGLVLSAATWIPWGAAAQAMVAASAAAAMLVSLELAQGGLAAAWTIAGVAVVGALATSIVVAAALARQIRTDARLAAVRAAADEAVRRSNADLRRIFETIDDIYFRTDVAGRIVAVSAAVARYGYSVEELIGSDSSLLYDDATVRPENVARLLAEGFLRDHEVILVAKDGRRVPSSANTRLLYDPAGKPVAIEGLLRDISERKRAEEELRATLDALDERVRVRTADLEVANEQLRAASAEAREAEHRFRTVSQLTSDYAYCFRLQPDFTTVVEWITEASFERVTGHTTDELDALAGGLGLLHPGDLAIAVTRLQTLFEGRTDVSEFRIVRKDGAVRWIREHGFPERDIPGGPVTRIYGAAQDITERKRAQEQLAAALRQRENVMETVPDVLYSLDRDGRLVDWNRRLEVVSGAGANRLARTPATELFVADDRDQVRASIALALATESQVTIEARMATAGGPRLYDYSAVPLRDESGAIIGLTGVGRDIADLKDAERRTAVLLDVARDVGGTLDVTEILDRIQHRAADLLLCDMIAAFCWDEATGTFRVRSHHGVPPDLAPQIGALAFPHDAPFDGVIAGGKSVVVEDTTAAPQLAGLVPPGRLIAAPLRARGRHLGALAIFRDGASATFTPAEVELAEGIATQLALALEGAELYVRQQEEATISAAAARVGQELIAALDGPDLLERLCKVTLEVLGCDASHTLFHRAESESFVVVAGHGYPAETWERIRVLDVPSAWAGPAQGPIDLAVQQVAIDELASVPRALVDAAGLKSTLVMPLFRGTELIGLHTASYLTAGKPFSRADQRVGERIAQLASLALDHARAVEAINEASRLKSEFVATMSHELRTPLNVVVGYHEMLLDGAAGELAPEQRELLERAERSARLLFGLISETLDLSRLESGQSTLETSAVSLAELTGELVAEAIELGGKNGVEIVSQVDRELPKIHTDAGKLRLVLKNLLGNALKFTQRGFVRITASASDDGVEIAVRDSGPGIPPEALEYVFEAFRQVDGSSTRQHDGVGLGLYIVRRLLDVLGGSIAVESEVGAGTTFRVRLPIRAAGRLAA